MSLTESEKQLVEQSIERVAEKIGDPTPAVYERLFSEQPEMKQNFILDTDDSAKGHMLAEALNCIFDLLGPRAYAPVLIQSELTNHSGFGVPPSVFAIFFRVMRDTFRDAMGDEWGADMDSAWKTLLCDVDGFIQEQAAKYGMEVG
ncbi:globin domain-containing protein [Parvibaculum sp.]|jgi:hemoglobin-like flavoprotein|uniref:globin domain-containing protein n=1 Tax=Parvibaculum sp. TaxID=2024848 RepID=UPI003C7098C3